MMKNVMHGRLAAAASLAVPALLCTACAVTKPYPAFPAYRAEQEGGEPIMVDAYRPAAIEQVERGSEVLQGMEVTLEVRSPETWRRIGKASSIMHRDPPTRSVGRVVVLGMVHAERPREFVPLYLFPAADAARLGRADRWWQFDSVLLGASPMSPLADYRAAHPDVDLSTLWVVGIDSVARDGKVQTFTQFRPAGQEPAEGLGLDTLLTPTRGALQAQSLATADSVHVLGHWLKLADVGSWAVRTRPASQPGVTTRAGRLAEYPYIVQDNWGAAEAAEDTLFMRLEAGQLTRARVLVVCVPAAPEDPGTRAACLHAGEPYLLQFGSSSDRVRQPFRIQRRGGLTSLFVGVGLVLGALAVSAG
jgi:hypothetical protein